MSIPRILELRISFIYSETFTGLLDGSAAGAPLAALGDPTTHGVKFEEIRQGMIALEKEWQEADNKLRSDYFDSPILLAAKRAQLLRDYQARLNPPGVLAVPWPWLGRNYIHHFWQYYLENLEPNWLPGYKAWEFVVPMRMRLPVKIGTPWAADGPLCKAHAEGFFYPHGVAVVLMLRLLFMKQSDAEGGAAAAAEPGVGLARMMDRALQARGNLNFPVTLPGGDHESLKLDALAAVLLNDLRRRALGKDAPQGDRPSQPLTVATVVQGRGWSADLPVVAQSDLHKALEGLCTWKDDWAFQAKLASLEAANLLVGGATPGHLVYHTERSRAVWMPMYFTSIKRREGHKMSCYHRNLTLVSLQTEMLAQALVYYTDYLDRGEAAPEALKSLARFAAVRIGYLYASLKKGSKKYTYNSASPRVYLKENDYEDLVNQARQDFKLSNLAYTPR
jgi:hypothetical protein